MTVNLRKTINRLIRLDQTVWPLGLIIFLVVWVGTVVVLGLCGILTSPFIHESKAHLPPHRH